LSNRLLPSLGTFRACALEAANELGDTETVEACRRVIDANLSGRLAMRSDMQMIFDYFR